MKTGFDLIETRLQALFESLDFLSSRDNKVALVKQIIEAMARVRNSTLHSDLLNYRIVIGMSARDFQTWMAHDEWITNIAQEIQNAAEDIMTISIPVPLMEINVNPSLMDGDIEVEAFLEDMGGRSGSTSVMEISENGGNDAMGLVPANAYLILNGVDQVPLQNPVVNLGRRRDNQIIIDDPRVSRNHAQLRSSNGHYVIFDLGSSGGTFVNGQRVSQQTLKPGDAISLAGMLLIYAESGSADRTDTNKLIPRSSAEPLEE